MKTDPIQEAVMPDTISPDDALTLALTSKRFARHVIKQALAQDPSLAGAKMHHTAKQRANADAIRENKVKPSEVKPKSRGGTSFRPLWDAEQLRLKLQSYDRTPFLDLLATWMECAPTPQTIMAFADKYPDRWTKAMLDLGRLGGFAERKEVDINLAAKVQRMSDSQLEDNLQEAAYRLGIPLPTLLSMTSRPADAPSPHSREAIDVTPEGEQEKA